MKHILLIVLTVLFSFVIGLPTAKAEGDGPYLVVMSSTNTSNSVFITEYHKVESMEQCYEIVQNALVKIPQGGDAESAIAMYCTPTKSKVLEYKDKIK